MENKMNPAFPENGIPVVFTCDNNYAKYLAVSIQSLIDNSKKENNYDLIVIDGGISDFNKDCLLGMSKDNVSIRFFDINPVITDIKKDLIVSGHFSIATYYRLFLVDILKTYQKIIYADCDVTFLVDIADLWNEKMDKDDFVAGVPDIGLISSMNGRIKNEEYFYQEIGVKKIDEYFNAGILVMNLENMRKHDFIKKCFEKLKQLKAPRFMDQDLLNSFCVGKVTLLPFKYNYWGNFKYENLEYKKYFPKEYLDKFEEASKNPAIIHYKPWEMPKTEKAYLFWQYARKTPFYEEILYANIFDINYIMRFLHLKRKIWLYNALYALTHNIKFKNKKNSVIAELYRRK